MIKNFVVTPSTIIFKPSQTGRSNRAIRLHQELGYHNFSWVNLRANSLSPDKYFLDVGNGMNAGILEKHVKGILTDGVRIYTKNFEFLHYSNSQMKAHSCWMYSQNGKTGQEILDSLGQYQE